jgi:hypothetical protein
VCWLAFLVFAGVLPGMGDMGQHKGVLLRVFRIMCAAILHSRKYSSFFLFSCRDSWSKPILNQRRAGRMALPATAKEQGEGLALKKADVRVDFGGR